MRRVAVVCIVVLALLALASAAFATIQSTAKMTDTVATIDLAAQFEFMDEGQIALQSAYDSTQDDYADQLIATAWGAKLATKSTFKWLEGSATKASSVAVATNPDLAQTDNQIAQGAITDPAQGQIAVVWNNDDNGRLWSRAAAAGKKPIVGNIIPVATTTATMQFQA